MTLPPQPSPRPSAITSRSPFEASFPNKRRSSSRREPSFSDKRSSNQTRQGHSSVFEDRQRQILALIFLLSAVGFSLSTIDGFLSAPTDLSHPLPTKERTVRQRHETLQRNSGHTTWMGVRRTATGSDNRNRATKAVGYSEGHLVVSGRTFTYRYSNLFASLGSDNTRDLLIVGVVSSSTNIDRRSTVRRTWADGANNVFFLVGGNWSSEVADEFFEHGDLLWSDVPETYRSLTYKVNVFLHTVHAHVKSYKYVMKTDDDCYVNLEMVGNTLFSQANSDRDGHEWDYWGLCIDGTPIRDPQFKWFISKEDYPRNHYPIYAKGVGYAVSSKFNACAISHISRFRYLPFEDASTGLLAEACGVTCQNDARVDNEGLIFHHNHYSEEAMNLLHGIDWDALFGERKQFNEGSN